MLRDDCAYLGFFCAFFARAALAPRHEEWAKESHQENTKHRDDRERDDE